MKDFNLTLNLKINEEFTNALEHLARVIEALPVHGTAAPVQPQAPAQTPVYTLDDLARKAQVIMDAGKLQPLTDLLKKYGVTMLPQLPPEQYAAFYADMEGLA